MGHLDGGSGATGHAGVPWGDMAGHEAFSGVRVLVLNWRDTSHPEGGGSELYVEQMLRGLVSRGASVTMVCPRYPGAATHENRDGIRILRVGGRLSIYLLVPLLMQLRRLPRHDLVVEVQNGVPFLAALYAHTPVAILVHHVHREQWPILFPAPVARFGWWLESVLAPRVGRRSRYITVSQATKDELARLGVDPERVSIVHNGSPAQGDTTAAERSPEPRMIVLGRLVPHKRVEVAIDVLARLTQRYPDAILDVVGEGWWHETLEQHAHDRRVHDKVRFWGRVDEETRNRLLGEAWVSAVPSVKEGWGLVIVEAGMQQTPSVAFRSAGGVRESIVDGLTGLLVDDVDGFAAAVDQIFGDADMRDDLGRWAEKHARGFTWPASQEKFAGVLGHLLLP
jgi:glycosyltransferase involved in cell wall biosynthesis